METQHTKNATESPLAAVAPRGFRRILVVTDRTDAARAAFALAREWAGVFGAELRVLEVLEAGRGTAGAGPGETARPSSQSQGLLARGTTLGARNRRLAEGIAEAARDSDADAIVLGVDRRRMAKRYLGRSLRDHLAATTDLPVLLAPAVATTTGSEFLAGAAESAGPVGSRELQTVGPHRA
jgi:nucleotide-binding universal stress UspA family protein